MFILAMLVVFLPLALNGDEKRNSAFSFFVPAFIILSLQLYGFKNVFLNLMVLNDNLQNFLKFDILGFTQLLVQGNYINEFQIFGKIYEIATLVFN